MKGYANSAEDDRKVAITNSIDKKAALSMRHKNKHGTLSI